MNSKAALVALAGLSIFVLAGCGGGHGGSDNGQALANVINPPAANNAAGSGTASSSPTNSASNASNTANSTSPESTTTSNGTGGSTAAATTSTSTNTTGGSSNGAENSPANSSNAAGSVNVWTVSPPSGTQAAAAEKSMASTIQTLLTNPPNAPTDCSALVQYVFTQAGVSVPRTVSQQATVGTRIASANQLQYGDIVFFDLSSQPNTPTFDGIYVGNGQVVAKTTHGIQAVPLNGGYWAGKFLYGQRVL
ncbi:MAG: C40 family peptidase [Alicyclobacillus sp.]|nr:C40 family peptidase [Alicyclobacillus sp.]